MSWPTLSFEQLYAEPSRNGVYKSKEHHGDGTKIVNMGELFAYNIINGQDMKRLRMSETELDKAGLADGDLLFGRRSLVEAGAGKCSLVENLAEPTTFESSIIRVRVDADRVRPRFIFYWLKSPVGAGRIRAIVTGTNVKGIRGSVLKTIEVPCPPTDIQDSITGVLRSYDDLIANNTRRIKLLEDAARLLYEEWFVRLRFPGHEHTPTHHAIPEGWERKTLQEVGLLYYGKALRTDDRVDGSFPVYGSSGIVGSHEKALVKGPGIIVGRKGNVGSVHLSLCDFWPIDTVYYVAPQKFSYFLLHNLKYQNFINGDAAVPGLNRNFAHSLPVLLPSSLLGEEFERQASVLYSQIVKLQQMNDKLVEARDLLLPRLMSGELAV